MKIDKRIACVATVCLFAGISAGWFGRASLTRPSRNDDGGDTKPKAGRVIREKVAVADPETERENGRLRKRVAQLEQQLERGRKDLDKRVTDAVETAMEEVEQNEDPRRRVQRHFERMKKRDPEGFARMQKHREQMRKDHQERERDRKDYLASLDMSKMSATTKATHEQLLAQIEKVERLHEQMRKAFDEMTENGAGESEEQHRARMEEMHEASQTLRELYAAERSNLLTETFLSEGYSADDAADFVSVIQTIYDSTSSRRGFGGPPRGGPPGGPR
ncbi:MAG: hypothetical protein J5985_09395 [Kiritimatiellae bacterium]|nr:hypothetical protein [Kiritimatiellia bacterium]